MPDASCCSACLRVSQYTKSQTILFKSSRPSFIAFLFRHLLILTFSSSVVVTLNRRPLKLDLDGQNTQPGPTYTPNPIPRIGECKIIYLGSPGPCFDR
jgi:hypothetical protein